MVDKNAVASRHLGLVHSLCKRFAGRGIDYEELYAAGCLGLSKALNSFDEAKGWQFSTYAFPVILGEIRRLFRDGGAVKVSRSLKELALKAARLNEESLRQNGAELTVGALAKKLDVSAERVAEALCCMQTPLSLTAEGEADTQIDVPTADIQYAVTERLALQDALQRLEAADRALIILRYFQSKTQTQTARQLNMTQVQVSRREKKILAHIRELMES